MDAIEKNRRRRITEYYVDEFLSKMASRHPNQRGTQMTLKKECDFLIKIMELNEQQEMFYYQILKDAQQELALV